jgi:nucleoside-specific outer membrane channel protein Tsx
MRIFDTIQIHFPDNPIKERIVKTRAIVIALLVTTLFPLQSLAADWSVTHLTFLTGNGFRWPAASTVDTPSSTFTIEQASGWTYGDNFFFIDFAELGTSSVNMYGEWSPRVSLNKTMGLTPPSFLKDILVALEFNVASGNHQVHHYGVGFDFNFPWIDLLQFNAFLRDDFNLTGTSSQLTFVWSKTFDVGAKIVFTGFIDIVGAEGTSTSYVMTQPQLYWLATDTLGIGLEYRYWNNKFGISGLKDQSPQLMVKWQI